MEVVWEGRGRRRVVLCGKRGRRSWEEKTEGEKVGVRWVSGETKRKRGVKELVEGAMCVKKCLT